MIIKISITLLIFMNIVLLYLINRKKIKNLIFKSKIPEVDISKLNNIFEYKKISQNLVGPKNDVIVKNFCISSDNNIVGMTSDYEAWIISSLSKISKNIFEFGTCSGKTTFLMALNSSDDTKITSITLNPNKLDHVIKDNNDSKVSFRNIKNESLYDKFLFSNTCVENKIEVIFQNSLDFDEKQLKHKVDLIFIDGGHTYSVVKNDTEKSLNMIAPRGIILWHDYVPGKKSSKDVVKYLEEISEEKKIFHIKNTSICYYQNS